MSEEHGRRAVHLKVADAARPSVLKAWKEIGVKWVVLILSVTLLTCGTASAADRAIKFTDIPDEVITDINPCTGTATTITIHHDFLVLRMGDDGAGGFHVTGTEVGSVETTDGFSGRVTVWFGFNVSAGGTAEQTVTGSITLRDGSGAVVLIRHREHLTFANGEVRVDATIDSATCLGKA